MAARVLFPREISPLLSVVGVLVLYSESHLIASAWQIVFLPFFSLWMFPLLTLIHWCLNTVFLERVLFRNNSTKNPPLPSLCEWLIKSISSQSCGRNSLIKWQVLFCCSWGLQWALAVGTEDLSGAAANRQDSAPLG